MLGMMEKKLETIIMGYIGFEAEQLSNSLLVCSQAFRFACRLQARL